MVVGSDAAPIRSQYIQRIAADIDINRQEQERLKARLAQLQEDEAYLLGLQSVSRQQDGAPSNGQSEGERGFVLSAEASDDSAPAVPYQRRSEPGSRLAASPGTADGKMQAAEPAESARETPTPDTKAVRLPLRRLVHDILVHGSGEPRSVSEVFAELTAAEPAGETSPQAVRNALESLVASGTATRERQGRSVFYVLQPAVAASAGDGSPLGGRLGRLSMTGVS